MEPEQVGRPVFLDIAIESMANAIRKITIERGDDVRDFVFVFHLAVPEAKPRVQGCRRAGAYEKIWLHPTGRAFLSAYGMGLASLRAERQQSVDVPLNDRENRKNSAKTIEMLRRSCDEGIGSPERST